LGNKYIEGSRDTLYRLREMGVPEVMKGTLLDLGCCFGAIATECFRRGARKVTGIDNNQDYIKLARRLARFNGYQINYQKMNMEDYGTVIDFVRNYYGGHVNTVFALSLAKHMPIALWKILSRISWDVLYAESNNAPEGLNTDHVKQMLTGMESIPSPKNITYIGQTHDRSPRCIWKITRRKS
jgi:hypothetical protein